jgi:hypothetical protein
MSKHRRIIGVIILVAIGTLAVVFLHYFPWSSSRNNEIKVGSKKKEKPVTSKPVKEAGKLASDIDFDSEEMKCDSEMRMFAISKSIEFKSDKTVPELLKLLNDPTPWVREAAAHGLGMMRSQEAIRPLTALLKDHYFWVRRSAAMALGRIGDKRCREALYSALEDKAWAVRYAASGALENLGDKTRSKAEKRLADAKMESRPVVKPVWSEITDAINVHFKEWLSLWKIKDSKDFLPGRAVHTEDYPSFKYPLDEGIVNKHELENGVFKYAHIYSPNRSKCVMIGLMFSIHGNEMGAFDGRGEPDQAVILIDMIQEKAWQLFCEGTSGGFSDVFWLNEDYFIVAGWEEVYSGPVSHKIDYGPYLWVFDSNTRKVDLYSGPPGKTISLHNGQNAASQNPISQYERKKFIPFKPQE